jgi:hypothetical protein
MRMPPPYSSLRPVAMSQAPRSWKPCLIACRREKEGEGGGSGAGQQGGRVLSEGVASSCCACLRRGCSSCSTCRVLLLRALNLAARYEAYAAVRPSCRHACRQTLMAEGSEPAVVSRAARAVARAHLC